ncbi:Histone H2A [Zea mays]|uniref:Histone H2A n=1 Tax=Zea mays TaxID=4577 RepID=A0A1D6GHW3_MAIZE|nr:Histone H2A [Zea mays]
MRFVYTLYAVMRIMSDQFRFRTVSWGALVL